jgi:hypothetical protein
VLCRGGRERFSAVFRFRQGSLTIDTDSVWHYPENSEYRINFTSAAISECYTTHMGDTPGLRRRLTVPTPSGRGASKEGRRQEGAFATPATPISCAPHLGSVCALRSCHQAGTPVHRKQQRTCLRPKRGPTKDSTRSGCPGSLSGIGQTDCWSRGDSPDTGDNIWAPGVAASLRRTSQYKPSLRETGGRQNGLAFEWRPGRGRLW